MEYPGRRRPFLVVAGLLGLCLAASLLLALVAGASGGFIAAGLFALVLVPILKRGFDTGPALIIDGNGVDARAAGTNIAWSDVRGVRHDAMPTPGTGARGFLIVELREGAEPQRSGPLAPRTRNTTDGPEVWISLTGVEANPGDVLDLARAEHRAGG